LGILRRVDRPGWTAYSKGEPRDGKEKDSTQRALRSRHRDRREIENAETPNGERKTGLTQKTPRTERRGYIEMKNAGGTPALQKRSPGEEAGAHFLTQTVYQIRNTRVKR